MECHPGGNCCSSCGGLAGLASGTSRRLSDYEYVQFENDVGASVLHEWELSFPQWGGVVQWRGMDVLLYFGPGGLYLTDVTGNPEFVMNLIPLNDPNAQWPVYYLPQELAARVSEVTNEAWNIGGAILPRIPDVLPLVAFAALLVIAFPYFQAVRR